MPVVGPGWRSGDGMRLPPAQCAHWLGGRSSCAADWCGWRCYWRCRSRL